MKQYNCLVFVMLTFYTIACHSQGIEIGANAQYIREMVEFSVSNQHRANPLHDPLKPYWTFETEYKNGVLKTITICKENDVVYGLPNRVDYCEKCVIENDTVKYLIREFNTISLQQMKDLYISTYAPHYIDEVFFSDDYQYYYKLYINKRGTAIAECHKTKSSTLQRSTLQKIESIKSLEIRNANKNDSIQKLNPPQRKIISKPQPKYMCNEQGRVVVKIIIDRDG